MGTLFYSLSVSLIGVSITSAIVAGTPVIAAVSAFFLLKEKMNLYKYIAIVFVILGIIIITLF